ncbi:MAG: SDR family NAD(P)-dependent oxidoreductase [Clostridia bacterium]|nr:SDR family NAD(P)-dependent oxidoreductase [Clostridia bacterium]
MKKNWLNNKIIIITGASGGLGFSIAKSLIFNYNCKVIGIGRNREKMLSAIETLGNKKENFSFHLFDVSVKENWLNFCEYLTTNNVKVDLLLNNAGFMLPFAKFDKYSDEEIDEIIKTNFLSVVTATKILFPLIKQSSTPAIVNISSAAGLCAVVGESMYCATKFAVKGFTETLQQDYRKQIYVGGVYPGFIKTDILNRQNGKAKDGKLVSKFMYPLDKATKKIVKGIAKRKKRIVFGFQGRIISLMSRLFPKTAPTIIAKVLKTSKLDMFDKAFD